MHKVLAAVENPVFAGSRSDFIASLFDIHSNIPFLMYDPSHTCRDYFVSPLAPYRLTLFIIAHMLIFVNEPSVLCYKKRPFGRSSLNNLVVQLSIVVSVIALLHPCGKVINQA